MIHPISRFSLLSPLVIACVSMAALPAGAQSEARLVADLNKSQRNMGAGIDGITALPNGVVFLKDSLAYGPELWVSRGALKTTTLLKDIVPGNAGSHPEGLLRSGDRVFFTATTVQDGKQIWVTDGTEAGTVKVTQHATGNAVGIERTLGANAEGVFFRAFVNEELPYELWFTDGTAAGTRLLNPLNQAGTERTGFEDAWNAEAANGRLYFLANDGELWCSDGTLAGTRALAEIELIKETYNPRMIIAGSRIYFVATPYLNPPEIWSCDLEGGNLTEVQPAVSAANWDIRASGALGDKLFLVLEDEQLVRTLWTSDGTAAGTHVVPLGSGYQPMGAMLEWNGHLYFGARSEAGVALYRTDGTEQGTQLVREIGTTNYGEIDLFVDGGGFLYFQYLTEGNLWEQWRTDGTTKGTRRVDRLVNANPLALGAQVAESNGSIYYAKGPGVTDNALWRTRGTKGVTRLTTPEKTTGDAYSSSGMEGVPYGSANGKFLSFIMTPDGRGKGYELWTISPKGKAKAIWKTPSFLSSSGTTLDFHGTLGANAVFRLRGDSAREVWTTNGTAKGTRRLSEHDSVGAQGYPQQFVTVGNKIFYSVMSGSAEYENELWVTDGTVAGTTKLDAAHNAAPVHNEMTNLNGTLYFLTAQSGGRRELWKSDGTVAGTVMVVDQWEPQDGTPEGLKAIGNRLSITLSRPLTEELWTSDGTEAGTQKVQPVYNVATQLASIDVSYDLGGKELILGRGVVTTEPYQWWLSDGTAAGTQRVQGGVTVDHLARYESQVTVAGGKAYYPGVDADGDVEPWVTDGTAAGTFRLKNIWPGTNPSSPSRFTAFGGQVYFTAYHPEHGLEVWKTDGTEAGTVLAADVEPGPEGSYAEDLKVVDGKLYFHALRRAIGRELYVIDGE
ncbi:hypothetical protein OJ996_22310 [Luteolibacter sp. GHJ8]|uniref:ELWxxDGT repeat protein n=1 Tax=Luteolibacter rhizosphaerae TaxID=2989719 RepID=A0ABT3G911_9BACT|nr:hypothetical protein [Luteolibacter rhizosphaerae]MCW1916339.1 hypothetical protein [Luteolibacter rhizosphaerae]